MVIHVGGPRLTVNGATPGLVILGPVGKQAEQDMGNKPVSSVPLCFSFCLQWFLLCLISCLDFPIPVSRPLIACGHNEFESESQFKSQLQSLPPVFCDFYGMELLGPPFPCSRGPVGRRKELG